MNKVMILIIYVFAELGFCRNLKNLSIWNEISTFWCDFAIVYKPCPPCQLLLASLETQKPEHINTLDKQIKQIYICYSSLQLAILDMFNRFKIFREIFNM